MLQERGWSREPHHSVSICPSRCTIRAGPTTTQAPCAGEQVLSGVRRHGSGDIHDAGPDKLPSMRRYGTNCGIGPAEIRAWRLVQGRYLVRVSVTSSGQRCQGTFRLINDVARTDFRLEPEITCPIFSAGWRSESRCRWAWHLQCGSGFVRYYRQGIERRFVPCPVPTCSLLPAWFFSSLLLSHFVSYLVLPKLRQVLHWVVSNSRRVGNGGSWASDGHLVRHSSCAERRESHRQPSRRFDGHG
jgi:hypothetical protein